MPDDPESSLPLASRLLAIAQQNNADFMVVGSVGKGGPAINQVGHVTLDTLATTTTLPVLVAPPTPINSTPLKRYVFVVAVDTSRTSHRCLNAALKLMRPIDLLRIVHFYREPVSGEYGDAKAMDYYREAVTSTNVGSNDSSGHDAQAHNLLVSRSTLQVEAVIDLEAMDEDVSIAEALQDYVAARSAAYLIMGLSGSGHEEKRSANMEAEEGGEVNSIGHVASAITQSPRCATCLCP
jgi:hypothetical protein